MGGGGRGELCFIGVGVVWANGLDGVETWEESLVFSAGGGDVRRGGAGHEEHVILVRRGGEGSRAGWVWWDGRGALADGDVRKGNCLVYDYSFARWGERCGPFSSCRPSAIRLAASSC